MLMVLDLAFHPSCVGSGAWTQVGSLLGQVPLSTKALTKQRISGWECGSVIEHLPSI